MKRNHVLSRALAALLSVCLTCCLVPSSAFAASGVSGSKVAGQDALSEDDVTTKVSLSLPGEETLNKKAEIVFVMDESGGEIGSDIQDAVTGLLTSLEEKEGLDVSVGVVQFDGWGVDAIQRASADAGGSESGLVKLDGGAGTDIIETAVTSDEALFYGGGSNSEQPIRVANAMLAGGDPDAQKYVVVLSDFNTYIYEGSCTIDGTTYDHIPVGVAGGDKSTIYDSTTTAYNKWSTLKDADMSASDAGSNMMFFRWGKQSINWAYTQDNWISYEKDGGGAYDTTPTTQWAKLDYDTFVKDSNAIAKAASDAGAPHMTGYQRSARYTYDALEASVKAGYNVVTYDNADADWHSTLKYIPQDMLRDVADNSDSASVYYKNSPYDDIQSSTVAGALDDLSAKVLYLVNSGTVTDVIGDDFDLVNDGSTCPFSLEFGGTALAVAKTGLYPYVVTYDPAATAGEQITWKINVPIEKARQITLSYEVGLTEVGKTAGTHATNKSAILDYTSTDGTKGSYTFDVPTVTYTPPVAPVVGPTTDAPSSTTEKVIAPVSKSGTPMTGDESDVIPAACLAVAGLMVVALGARRRA